MEYFSTRNLSLKKSFSNVVLEGLAPDGGLYLPSHIPNFKDSLEKLSKLNYPDLAVELFIPFFGSEYTKEEISFLVQKSYLTFPKPALKLVHLERHSILELFYGPTFSFKDYAMQFLGNLFEFVLRKKNQQLNILGATSGDTGSAAIYSIRGKKNLAFLCSSQREKLVPFKRCKCFSKESLKLGMWLGRYNPPSGAKPSRTTLEKDFLRLRLRVLKYSI